MKKSIIILLLFLSFSSFGQQAPKMPKFIAKNSAKIFYYNFSEVPGEIKVKDEATKNKTIKLLKDYNYKIKKISFLNTPQLSELELTINTLGEKLYSDRALAENIRKRIQVVIFPIRDSINLYEKNLNEDFKSFLSKKQLKKWMKYQRAELKKLIPKQPKTASPPPQSMSRRRNQQQGMGGRRY